MAYIRRQVRTMIFRHRDPLRPVLHVSPRLSRTLWLSLGISVAFLMGVSASYGAGFVGMWLAVKGNVRSANAALTSFKDAMELAFKAGGVSGMVTVGLDCSARRSFFWYFQQNAMKVLVGFGFGGSLAALFMRVGGGIYTKAADVGGDLVGKVEAGISGRRSAQRRDYRGQRRRQRRRLRRNGGRRFRVVRSHPGRRDHPRGLCAQRTGFHRGLYGALAGAFAMKLIIFALILRGGRRVLLDPRHHGGARAGRARCAIR